MVVSIKSTDIKASSDANGRAELDGIPDGDQIIEIFGEKMFGKISVFINAENITDTRQSRFGPVVLPPHRNPTFSEIYMPTDGRIINGGIKLRF